MGEHIFLWLTDEQRNALGVGLGDGPATVAMVKDVALRPVTEPPTDKYVADVFAEAVMGAQWSAKLAYYGSAGDSR